MSHRYPAAAPFQEGVLDVGDGQLLHWEQCGNPYGKPAVVLHGGPGSGCSLWMRGLFDPSVYRVVLFDQRGAGQSRPHAGDPTADLSVNTTAHLIADIERLREHLDIERWLVHGMSWGSTLGLAYTQAYPQQVSEVVLAAVTMTRRCDVDWLARGVGRFFPAQWQAFRDGVSPADRDGDLLGAYARLLASSDAAVREQAARDWCAWEEAIVSGETGGTPNPRYADARFRLGFARLVTHHFSHAAWLEEDQLLTQMHTLAGIPTVLIHGQLDLGSPLQPAWQVAQAWPGSHLVVLDAAGHTSGDLGDHVVAATDRFSPARPY